LVFLSEEYQRILSSTTLSFFKNYYREASRQQQVPNMAFLRCFSIITDVEYYQDISPLSLQRIYSLLSLFVLDRLGKQKKVSSEKVKVT